MKKTTFSSAAFATLFLTIVGVDNAYALPSFARQTGLSCTMCHAGGQFPALTEMGRQFKLGGYTMGGGETKMPLPLAAMIQVDMSSTKNGSNATAAASANGVNENNKINFPQMSVFYGGKIYDNFGAFVQITYDSSDLPKDLTTRRIAADNTDIRYGNNTTLLDNSLIYGASLNNNPTVQDIYASTPAWGFPWATPSISAGIPGPMIEGLGGNVIGMNAYGLYADTLYAEFGGYQDSYNRNDILKNLTFNGGPIGLQSGNDGVLNGTAPYLRLALQHTSGDNFFMIGGYGSKMNIKQAGTNQLDEYTDVALDGEYQYIADTHSLTLTARNTWEKQTLNGSYDGVNANLHQSLSVFSAMAAYTFDSKYGVNLGYNQATGSGYVSSQDSSAYLIEAAYTPIESVRIVLQGMIFTKLNGQTGSAASDNNTITLGAWLMF
ncbi:MAG: hypothetical protein PHX13_05605 [Thiovulaceae bacterium]|nr:hypothetical protein [Sulfurimonadaceae bacterium]